MFFKKKESASPVDFLVVGLGNPESKYDNTRHNAGFIALDKCAEKWNIRLDKLKYKALIGEGQAEGYRVILMKPQTYMNLSGEAVTEAMRFYKLEPSQVIVMFDDISLDVGQMRIRRKGSHGGHNGMKNISLLSGSELFPRIKIGVGKKPHPDYDLAAWVLSKFTKDERALIDKCAENCVSACELMMSGKTDEAMNRFNS